MPGHSVLDFAASPRPDRSSGAWTRTPITRRGFFRAAAAGGLAALLPAALAGCNGDPFDPTAEAVIDLGTDAGVLNGLYALTQLKGELFHRLAAAPFPGMTVRERETARDLRDHATARAGWLIERLRDRRVYDYLTFDFTAADLSTRAGALARAAELADRVAAAWLAAAVALRGPGDARVVAKAAAVESRHAAVVRSLQAGTNTAFAAPPAVGADGAARVESLAAALEAVRPYFRTSLVIRS